MERSLGNWKGQAVLEEESSMVTCEKTVNVNKDLAC